MHVGAGELFGVERFARTRDGRVFQHMMAGPQSAPVVVFVSGLGGAHTQWSQVQPHRQVGASHARLAQSVSQGRHVEVDADHSIRLTEPKAVVSAIVELIETSSR